MPKVDRVVIHKSASYKIPVFITCPWCGKEDAFVCVKNGVYVDDGIGIRASDKYQCKNCPTVLYDVGDYIPSLSELLDELKESVYSEWIDEVDYASAIFMGFS